MLGSYGRYFTSKLTSEVLLKVSRGYAFIFFLKLSKYDREIQRSTYHFVVASGGPNIKATLRPTEPTTYPQCRKARELINLESGKTTGNCVYKLFHLVKIYTCIFDIDRVRCNSIKRDRILFYLGACIFDIKLAPQ
jgi:hypothetical protein